MKLKDIINEGKELTPIEKKELKRIRDKAQNAAKDYDDALKSLQRLIDSNESLADNMRWVDKTWFKWVKMNNRENLGPSTIYKFVTNFINKYKI